MIEELGGGHHGSGRRYLRALNFMLFDAFARHDVPPPAPTRRPNATRREAYYAQLRAWDGLKSRAFAVLETAADHCAGRKCVRVPPPVAPVGNQAEMVPVDERCANDVGS